MTHLEWAKLIIAISWLGIFPVAIWVTWVIGKLRGAQDEKKRRMFEQMHKYVERDAALTLSMSHHPSNYEGPRLVQ